MLLSNSFTRVFLIINIRSKNLLGKSNENLNYYLIIESLGQFGDELDGGKKLVACLEIKRVHTCGQSIELYLELIVNERYGGLGQPLDHLPVGHLGLDILAAKRTHAFARLACLQSVQTVQTHRVPARHYGARLLVILIEAFRAQFAFEFFLQVFGRHDLAIDM